MGFLMHEINYFILKFTIKILRDATEKINQTKKTLTLSIQLI